MSSLEDDSISGSVIVTSQEGIVEQPIVQKPNTPITLRDKILHYVDTHDKPTKGGIFTHVSASGSAGSIVSAFIREGIFIEKKFDCGNCVYFELDKKRARLA